MDLTEILRQERTAQKRQLDKTQGLVDAASVRCIALYEQAREQVTAALTGTDGLGELVWAAAPAIEVRRSEGRVQMSYAAEAQGVNNPLLVLVMGAVGWLFGDGVNIGRGWASEICVNVSSRGDSKNRSLFRLPVGEGPLMTGRFPVQREAMQQRLAEAVRDYARRTTR